MLCRCTDQCFILSRPLLHFCRERRDQRLVWPGWCLAKSFEVFGMYPAAGICSVYSTTRPKLNCLRLFKTKAWRYPALDTGKENEALPAPGVFSLSSRWRTQAADSGCFSSTVSRQTAAFLVCQWHVWFHASVLSHLSDDFRIFLPFCKGWVGYGQQFLGVLRGILNFGFISSLEGIMLYHLSDQSIVIVHETLDQPCGVGKKTWLNRFT